MSQSKDIPSAESIPLPARALGFAGLIPFLVWGGSLAGLRIVDDEFAWRSFQAYAATILSFLGAVHWGAAMTQYDGSRLWRPLALSVVPCLLGWAVLSLQPPPAGSLALLMLGFGGQFMSDRLAVDRGLFPPWYLSLRRVLTLVVLAVLGLTFVLSPITAIGR